MRKKSAILILIGILIIVAIIIFIVLQGRISSSINKNGDELPILDEIIEKKYIKKEEGRDSEGNSYITLYYNPKDVSNTDTGVFESTIMEFYDFQEIDEDDFEEGIKYVGPSNDRSKMWIVTIYRDADEAYVKYVKCNNTLLDYDNLVPDYSNYMFDENEDVKGESLL